MGRVDRIHWYSLYDLPKTREATTRHREAEGSSYYRHFHMGLLREDGSPKAPAKQFAEYTPEFGICQWFHFEDHRLGEVFYNEPHNFGLIAKGSPAYIGLRYHDLL